MKNPLLPILMGLLRISPAYVVLGIILGWVGLSPVLVILPVFLVFIPAVLYIMLQRCPNCRNRIYTPDNMRKSQMADRSSFVPFKTCPMCGSAL